MNIKTLNREDFLSFKTENKMTGNARINATMRSVHVTTVAAKVTSITYSECVSVALVI